MRTSRFRTTTVFDHAMRALDELRRMNFVLVSMTIATIATDETDIAEVRIDYEPVGPLRAETWMERVRKMPGVFDCCDIKADDASAEMSAKTEGLRIAGYR
ncbi:hypothetical protein [Martelella soudanensis]|uniref:hypothetical protein n=1 Tax=unclassified Martelella TaxID=2629616 RepID=UPI0015DFBFBA|nr:MULTISPECIES: hypothetical protein [unclassified Martelella]